MNGAAYFASDLQALYWEIVSIVMLFPEAMQKFKRCINWTELIGCNMWCWTYMQTEILWPIFEINIILLSQFPWIIWDLIWNQGQQVEPKSKLIDLCSKIKNQKLFKTNQFLF